MQHFLISLLPTSPLQILLYALVYLGGGFGFWYLVYGLTSYINGGSSHGKWWVYKCFWEEVLWFGPGGMKRRTDYIRNIVEPEHFQGFIGKYSYEEIRAGNLYEQVAKKTLGNAFVFWCARIPLYIFWPVPVALFLLLSPIGALWDLTEKTFTLWQRSFQWSPSDY